MKSLSNLGNLPWSKTERTYSTATSFPRPHIKCKKLPLVAPPRVERAFLSIFCINTTTKSAKAWCAILLSTNGLSTRHISGVQFGGLAGKVVRRPIAKIRSMSNEYPDACSLQAWCKTVIPLPSLSVQTYPRSMSAVDNMLVIDTQSEYSKKRIRVLAWRL